MRHAGRLRTTLRTLPARLIVLTAISALFASAAAFRQVRQLPNNVSFEPRDDANLAFNGVVGERCSRSYTITNTSNQRLRVFIIKLTGHADFEKFSDTRGVYLDPGAAHIVTVTYAPKRAGQASTARLQFNVSTGGQSRTATIELSGLEGKACTPPPEAPGGGGPGVDPGAGGIVDPATGFTDFGAVTQDEKQHSICVRFHFVNAGWGADGGQAPLPEKLRECVRLASGWYRGVDFTLRPENGVPEVIETPDNDADFDPHCINVYIVHDMWFEQHPEEGDTPEQTRRKAGHTETRPPRGGAWMGDQERRGVSGDLKDAGVNGDYVDAMGAGTRITIEAGDHLCSTLAHELGHALGLGSSSGDAHNQPDDNAEIGDPDRLMHKNGNGSKLSDAEQQVAKRVAQYMAETMLLKCDETKRTREPETEPPPPPRNDFRRATIFNHGETLRFEARTAYPFDPREAAPQLDIELDGNLDGTADLSLRYRYAGGAWQIESTPALPDSMPLLEPSFVRPAHALTPASTRAVSIDVPRAVLPGEANVIGWRVTAAIPAFDARSTIPAEFDGFDITVPALAFTLADARELRAAPGAALELTGSLLTSSTFAGDVDITMMLAVADTTLVLPVTALSAPLPASWSAAVALPDTLPAGRYLATLHASCSACNLDTHIVTQVVVGEERGSSTLLRIVAVLLGLAIVALIALMALRMLQRADASDRAA